MWYDRLGIISIAGHSGGPADGGLSHVKIDLWKLFLRHCKSTYCRSINHFAILLLVGGEFQQFETESFSEPKRNKKDKTIEMDIVIPEEAWQMRTPNQVRDYLAKRVRDGLELCVDRLMKDKEAMNKHDLFRDVDAAISEFMKINYEGRQSFGETPR